VVVRACVRACVDRQVLVDWLSTWSRELVRTSVVAVMPSRRGLCWCLGGGSRPDISYNAAVDNAGLELTTIDSAHAAAAVEPMPTDDEELNAKFATIVVRSVVRRRASCLCPVEHRAVRRLCIELWDSFDACGVSSSCGILAGIQSVSQDSLQQAVERRVSLETLESSQCCY